MNESELIIRSATVTDIDIIVEAIIAAEKSGSNVLSYTAIFGLTEEQTRGYLKEMLEEEIDGCELSLSSYLIAEFDNESVAVMGAWIEGDEDMPSSTIKGNLLGFVFPKESIKKASKISSIISAMSIEYIKGSLSIGIVYVREKYRGQSLVSLLLEEHINRVLKDKKDLEIYIQVFGNNIAAIKAYKNLGFKEYKKIESNNKEVLSYLPFNKKVLLKK